MGKVELLAPAGDMACFKAAINAGADAVYLGGEEYGARAYASNFSKEELCRAIDYAHLFNIGVYLTVNTLVKERELEGVCSFLEPLYEAGLDGVIVQDLGVLEVIKEKFPYLALHASTQMCITGKFGAECLKKYGVSRIVPARELSLDELSEIKKETGLEIEAFIHGAMCYSYSGQCLFSSFLGGRSGNRGRCAGPCRLPYSVFDQKEVYPLSLKDMCTLPIIDKLMDAGIDSFKIEGRMKNPYYVAGVTSVYRKYIDLYENGENGKEGFGKGLTESEEFRKDLELLQSLYVRTSLETGYYYRHNGEEMVTIRKPGYETGDEKQFSSLKEEFLDKDKKVELQCHISVNAGEIITLKIYDKKGNSVTCHGTNPVQKAQKRPVTEEDVKKQLLKTGNTAFYFSDVSVIMSGEVFVPLKEINELRRDALNRMEGLLTWHYKRTEDWHCKKTEEGESAEKNNISENVGIRERNVPSGERAFSIAVSTAGQLNDIVSWIAGQELSYENGANPEDGHEKEKSTHISVLELGFSVLENIHDIKKAIHKLKEKGISVRLTLPPVFRKAVAEYLDRLLHKEELDLFDGFYCGSLDALEYIKKRLEQEEVDPGNKTLAADHNLYTANHKAAIFLHKQGVRNFVAPYELNRYEWKELKEQLDTREELQDLKTEYTVYGHIPFMQSAGCVKKTFRRCDGKNGITYLTDRMGKKLPVVNFCSLCQNTVYNSIPLYLYEEMKEIACDIYRIVFTVENSQRIKEVLSCFLAGRTPDSFEHTKGHFKKGIE